MTNSTSIPSYWGELKEPRNYLDFFIAHSNENTPQNFAQFTLNKLTINNPFIDPEHILTELQIEILDSIIQHPSNDVEEDYRLICYNLSSEQLDSVGW